MTRTQSILIDGLAKRRRVLGMSYAALSERSGVSEPTVKRVLGGRAVGASYGTIEKIAAALGASLELREVDSEQFRADQAHRKSTRLAAMVQGTSSLEGQGIDKRTYQRLVERSCHELLAGSRRRLWSS